MNSDLNLEDIRTACDWRLLFFSRQRQSAPINLVMEQEWKEKYRPTMDDAAEEADDDEDEEEFTSRSDEDSNRHKYSL